MLCFCIMYRECDIWFLHHFNDFFENAISCICQINIIFISFYINSLSFYVLVSNRLVAFSYPICNMQKRSIFFSEGMLNLQRVSLHVRAFLIIFFHIWSFLLYIYLHGYVDMLHKFSLFVFTSWNNQWECSHFELIFQVKMHYFATCT